MTTSLLVCARPPCAENETRPFAVVNASWSGANVPPVGRLVSTGRRSRTLRSSPRRIPPFGLTVLLRASRHRQTSLTVRCASSSSACRSASRSAVATPRGSQLVRSQSSLGPRECRGAGSTSSYQSFVRPSWSSRPGVARRACARAVAHVTPGGRRHRAASARTAVGSPRGDGPSGSRHCAHPGRTDRRHGQGAPRAVVLGLAARLNPFDVVDIAIHLRQDHSLRAERARTRRRRSQHDARAARPGARPSKTGSPGGPERKARHALSRAFRMLVVLLGIVLLINYAPAIGELIANYIGQAVGAVPAPTSTG